MNMKNMEIRYRRDFAGFLYNTRAEVPVITAKIAALPVKISGISNENNVETKEMTSNLEKRFSAFIKLMIKVLSTAIADMLTII